MAQKKQNRATILITGASSGIGKEMAFQFAAMGRHLALCARRLPELDDIKHAIVQQHPNAVVYCYALDVNDHDAVFATFTQAQADLGGLDCVIVNAGIGKGQPIGKGQVEANLKTANTNFVAALVQCEAAMQLFRAAQHGHLVTIASVASVRGASGNGTTYAATKAGLRSLTEGIRLEMKKKKKNIAVTTILPGFIDTELTKGLPSTPFMVSTPVAVKEMIDAIEHEADEACVPALPWRPIAGLLRYVPEFVLAKFM